MHLIRCLPAQAYGLVLYSTPLGGEDYVGLEAVLLNFGPSSNEACFEIVVLDDDIEETEEMFLLSGFYVLNGGTGGGAAIVMVSILDDDCELLNIDKCIL